MQQASFLESLKRPPRYAGSGGMKGALKEEEKKKMSHLIRGNI